MQRSGQAGVFLRHQSLLGALLALLFCVAAGACSVIALANGPVGPADYSPGLTELRPDVRGGSTLVLVPQHVLADEHGRDYVVWELRGGRVCVTQETPATTGATATAPAPAGIARVITSTQSTTPYAGFGLQRRSGPYVLWVRRPAPSGDGPCPLIAPGARANPGGD